MCGPTNRRTCERHGAGDQPYLRKAHEEVGRDGRKQVPDERRRDYDRDVDGGSAQPTHDDRHERDEHGYVDASADRAERVDPEVTANACGRPVDIHTRTRTLAPEAALLEGPRGGYLGSISRTEVRPRPVSTRSRTEAAPRTVAARPAASA